MKKFFAFLLALFEFFSFPASSYAASISYNVLNLGQKGGGGFFVLDGGGQRLSKPYVGGGAVNFYWRDFEPQEGVYRWDLLTQPLAEDYHSYWERTICEMCKSQCASQPNTCRPACNPDNPSKPADCANCRYYNPDDCTKIAKDPTPGAVFYDADQLKKTVRLRLMVDQGGIPLWLYGGMDFNARRVQSSYGTICRPGITCHPNTDIALTSMWPIDAPGNQGFVSPVWWNPVFQQKLKTTLIAIGNRIESDPALSRSVEFVEAAVGNFGEMLLYSKWDSPGVPSGRCGVDYLWKHAGYTNKVYGDGVLGLLSIYMEAFPNHHIALSLGSGLYSGICPDGSGVSQVEKYVLDEAMARWGGRLYLKFAGFGGGGNQKTSDFSKYCPSTTKCIYENWGGVDAWTDGESPPHLILDKENQVCNLTALHRVLSGATGDAAYIVMMWYEDWSFINSLNWPLPESPNETCAAAVEKAFSETASVLGPQFVHQNISFTPSVQSVGKNLNIRWTLQNWSENSLLKFNRVGNKDITDSYPIYFDLVDNSGRIAFKTTYIPKNSAGTEEYGTNKWKLALPGKQPPQIISKGVVYLPWSLAPGTYTPRIGIILDDRGNKFWAIGGFYYSETGGPYPINIPITISGNPEEYSVKKSWNSLSWDSSKPINPAELLKNCPVVSKLTAGKFIPFVENYSSPSESSTLNGNVIAKCR